MRFTSNTGRVLAHCLVAALTLIPAASFADGGKETAGSVLAIGLPLVAAGIALAQDDSAGLWQLAKSETAALAATEALKHTVHEDRPNGRDDNSFPSRHAAASFAAAQYLQTRGGWEYGVPAYAAAALVGYSRVRAHEHYWKDVAAGAGIGIASAYFFTDPRERTRVSVIAGPRAAHLQLTAFW